MTDHTPQLHRYALGHGTVAFSTTRHGGHGTGRQPRSLDLSQGLPRTGLIAQLRRAGHNSIQDSAQRQQYGELFRKRSFGPAFPGMAQPCAQSCCQHCYTSPTI